ncbi:TetR family transcriptional regulator [Rhodobacteraceae bacterium 2CG4]|uniref:TetR family transcriptional regulator n=2 Tax=Halovulum marinum TaxID=2662447 RepID=A0A6L5YYC5_9RHOB|nr:TetR family transcriptional regulator [Halovulum marinum]
MGEGTGRMDQKNAANASGKARTRDPERTERNILIAAREEFVEYGYQGARIDRIAERAGSNKRMLYHYVGNKDALYARVLLEAYKDIRKGERQLHLGRLQPRDAMERLVGFTFDHFQANPWFIRLLSTENMLRARYLAEVPEIKDLHSPIIMQIREVLEAGEAAGDFRTGVDPLQLYITIAGVSYFYFSNMYTLSVAFNDDIKSEQGRADRRAHAIDVVMSFLCSKPLASK